MRPCREYQGKVNRAGYARRFLPGLDGVRRLQMLHRWVVEQAEGVPLKPWPEEIVMHTCDNPPCFLYEHLRRATSTDNNRDAVAKGRAKRYRGEDHHNAKLTASQVRDIKYRYPPGRLPRGGLSALVTEFGVSRTLVKMIREGRAWAHV